MPQKNLSLIDGKVNFTIEKVDSHLISYEVNPVDWVDFMPFLVKNWVGVSEEDLDPTSSDVAVDYSKTNCNSLFSQRDLDPLQFKIILECFSSDDDQNYFDWDKVYDYAINIYSKRLAKGSISGALSKLYQMAYEYNHPVDEKDSSQKKEEIEPNYGNPYCILANEHLTFFEILRESRSIQGGFGVIYNSIHISELIDYYQKVIAAGHSFTAKVDSVWGINRYLLLMKKLDSIYINFQHDEAEKRRKENG